MLCHMSVNLCHDLTICLDIRLISENKWHLIINLSAPEGYSINDGIGKELSSVSYNSVDNVVACILKLGRGALLANFFLSITA